MSRLCPRATQMGPSTGLAELRGTTKFAIWHATKPLCVCLDELGRDSRHAVLLVDLSTRAIDMLKAFVIGAFSRPRVYVGLRDCDDGLELVKY